MVSSPLDRSGAAESERGDTRQKQILLRFFVATRPQGFQTEPQRGKIDGGISGRGVGYLIDEARARPPGDSVLGPARGRILWKAGRPSYKPSAGGGAGGDSSEAFWTLGAWRPPRSVCRNRIWRLVAGYGRIWLASWRRRALRA